MNIVENSYYEHERYGRVKVVDVTNGVVSFQRVNETISVAGDDILAGTTQSAAGFQADAEPADVTVSATAAVFDLSARDA